MLAVTRERPWLVNLLIGLGVRSPQLSRGRHPEGHRRCRRTDRMVLSLEEESSSTRVCLPKRFGEPPKIQRVGESPVACRIGLKADPHSDGVAVSDP